MPDRMRAGLRFRVALCRFLVSRATRLKRKARRSEKLGTSLVARGLAAGERPPVELAHLFPPRPRTPIAIDDAIRFDISLFDGVAWVSSLTIRELVTRIAELEPVAPLTHGAAALDALCLIDSGARWVLDDDGKPAYPVTVISYPSPTYGPVEAVVRGVDRGALPPAVSEVWGDPSAWSEGNPTLNGAEPMMQESATTSAQWMLSARTEGSGS